MSREVVDASRLALSPSTALAASCFNLIASMYESRSILIMTTLAFSEWPKVFADDEKLTTALLDRLGHHATVITTQGKSFRMRKRAAKSAKPA